MTAATTATTANTAFLSSTPVSVCHSTPLSGASSKRACKRRPHHARPSPCATLTPPLTWQRPAPPATIEVTVRMNNKSRVIAVDREVDLRSALLEAKVDLYSFKGKLTNCGGGGSCGTCLIAVEDGVYNTNGRTPREEFLLDGKPHNFRLACRTMVTGQCTVAVKPRF